MRADAAYDEEQKVVGDLDPLDAPSTTASIGAGGSGAVRAFLERMKAEDPAEPLWSGVTAIDDAEPGVTVHFEPAPGPALRRVGNVDVACILYPPEPAD
jgi:peptide/nickel transport system ATP-binding protein